MEGYLGKSLALVSINPFLERMIIGTFMQNKHSGKIFIIHCGIEDSHNRNFDLEFFEELDKKYGVDKSRYEYAERVENFSINNETNIQEKLNKVMLEADVAIFDSHYQGVRHGKHSDDKWFEKNRLLFTIFDFFALSQISKKIFLNYPFNVFQTRKEIVSNELFSISLAIREGRMNDFLSVIKTLPNRLGVHIGIVYSSLAQIYLRERHAEIFFMVETPFLVAGLYKFKGLYLPQGQVIEDLICFLGDGLFNKVLVPMEGKVPIMPVDVVCDLLFTKILSEDAMTNHLYGCTLNWQKFLFMASDHFKIHHFYKTFSGHEINVDESPSKVSINMISERLPTFLLSGNKSTRLSLASHIKEFRMLMLFSFTAERSSLHTIPEMDWKLIIDHMIYGIRKFHAKESLIDLENYLRYGIMSSNVSLRKHNFFHLQYLRDKIRNVNEVKTSYIKGRLLNCDRLREEIEIDVKRLVDSVPGITPKEIQEYRQLIEQDLEENFKLLSTHFEKIGMLALTFPVHYIFRKMYDGVYFDNSFVEFVRNHDYRHGPIILIPTHKSYFDFLIITYLLVMRDGQPPLIGAADNMNNIFLISELFKRSGAFYIKRTGQKFPKIYRTLLSEFIKTILEKEINIEFFIEATRSRTGQILYPKYGFLKYVVEAYFEKKIPNATLIPINITYENILESDSYIVEHRGGQKVKEDTLRVLKGLNVIRKKFGKIVVRSAKPLTLKQYLQDNPALSRKGVVDEQHNLHTELVVENLGLDLCETLQNESLFMITHLVCAVILMRYHYQLVKDVERYVRVLELEIKRRNGTIFDLDQSTFNFDYTIKCFSHRLSVRGETLNEKRVCINKKNYIENVIAVKYYANSMNYLFFEEALIYYCIISHSEFEVKMSIDTLWNRFTCLKNILKGEIFLRRWIETQEELIALVSSNRMKMLVVSQESTIDCIQQLYVEVKNELEDSEYLLVELYNQIIPPIFFAFMITFVCILKTKSGQDINEFLRTVQKLAEKVHSMGLSQNPSFCSMLYIKGAYKQAMEQKYIIETKLPNGKTSWKLVNSSVFAQLIARLKDDHNLDSNYKIIKRVFFAESSLGDHSGQKL